MKNDELIKILSSYAADIEIGRIIKDNTGKQKFKSIIKVEFYINNKSIVLQVK